MKKIILALLLIPSLAFGQNPGIQNESLKTLASTAGTDTKLSTDKKGRLLLSSQNGVVEFVGLKVATDTAETGSTATVIADASHVVVAGDYLLFTAGTAGNIGFGAYVTSVTTGTITLASALPATPANGDAFTIYRPTINTSIVSEDVPHVSGDQGYPIWGVRNDAAATFSGTNLDYTPISVGQNGTVMADLCYLNSNCTNANSLLKPEDLASNTGDVGVMSLFVAQDPLTSDQGTNGDYGPPKMSRDGKVYITMAPVSEMFNACSGVASGTADVAIKAAVASNRIYVTSLECTNTAAAVSTQLVIDDAAAQVWTMYVSSTALGFAHDSITFNPPLRMAAVNTALNVKPIITSSATTCCAAGYISTQ